MNDKIYKSFLDRQQIEGTGLAKKSDLLNLALMPGPLPNRYIAQFLCKGLVKTDEGGVEEANRFEVGIVLPSDYLRRADPAQVLTWLGPRAIFHPNIRPPFICVGRLVPGTSLVDILYQLYEMISYQLVTMREDDALDTKACQWCRANQHRFPLDSRPLTRRKVELNVEVARTRGKS